MDVTSSVWTASLGPLIRFFFVLGSVLGSAIPSTLVALNNSATLCCPERCRGGTEWKRLGDTVAQCGQDTQTGLQFICTAKEGGSFLTVPQVNYSTRGHYSVYCNGNEMTLCRQLLQPLPDQSTLELEAEQHLRMDFYISDPVIITFRSPGNSSSMQLCTVDGRVKQCHPDYQDRLRIVDNTFMLMDVLLSDSGIYTVKEKEGVTVRISNVTIKDVHHSWKWKEGYCTGFGHGSWAVGIGALIVGVLLGKFIPSPVSRRRESPHSHQEDKENGILLNGIKR